MRMAEDAVLSVNELELLVRRILARFCLVALLPRLDVVEASDVAV